MNERHSGMKKNNGHAGNQSVASTACHRSAVPCAGGRGMSFRSKIIAIAAFAMMFSLFMTQGLLSPQNVAAASATGACTITTVGSDEIVTCTGDGTFTPSLNLSNVQILTVGGGGGGGGKGGTSGYSGGGGGAGGYIYSATNSLNNGTQYTITVGSGGAAGSGTAKGGNGGGSSISGTGFTTITAIGGGGAGSGSVTAGQNAANTGGSGGGGGRSTASGAGAAGTAGQGNAGVNAANTPRGGGGGGASAAGATANGGAGTANTISGVSVNYACGGGAGAATPGTAGCTNAGAGISGTNGFSGTANTGGGGGGVHSATTTSYTGGSGGSGIVIIRYTPDTIAPTVTINQAVGQADPTNASPINFAVVFSEPVLNFATGDVTLSGTAGATTATVTGSGPTYNVAVSGMTSPGTVITTIGAGVATDAAGNGNAASTSTDNTVAYDATAPTVNITVAASTSGSPVTFTVTFSESVTGFINTDVTIGGTAGGTKSTSVSGSGANYTIDVTGMTTSGTITALIAAGSAIDPASNGNTVSNTASTNWSSCTDTSVGTITIPAGQTVSGSSVVLTTLYTVGGTPNFTGFTYKINGSGVTTPWNSSAFGTAGPEAVTLEVTGNDPDCGGSTVVASGSITVNNFTGTAAGTATVTAADKSIAVTAPYTGDVNGNNSVKIEWGLNGVDFLLGSVTRPHAASPYTYTIPGLTNGTAYQVRVTYQETVPDTVSGTAVQTFTNIIPKNLLMHNSLTTGSLKWSAQGGWGVASGQYGEFNCATCHAKNTAPNIKRIRTALTQVVPTRAISFTTVDQVTNPAGDGFGDDSDARGTTVSDRICEVCHTQTSYHRATTNTTPSLTHYNKQDCIGCHKHNAGFKADCAACHGNPPTVSTLGGPNGLANNPVATGSATNGKHDRHAVQLGYGCNTCHTGWQNSGEMPKNGNLNIGFVTTGFDGGTYNGRALPGGKYTVGATTPVTNVTNTGALTCASVYCHGTDVPTWNAVDTAPCGSCHGNATGVPTQSAGDGDLSGATSGYKVGKHAIHLSISNTETGDNCTLCHQGVGYGTATHVDGDNDIVLHSAAGGSAGYATGAPGTCSNLSCHQNAPWDSAATGGCSFCHGGGSTGTTAKNYWPDATGNANDAGRHQKHVLALAEKLFAITTVSGLLNDAGSDTKQKQICAYCHEDPAGTNFTAGTALHRNGATNVTLHQLWQSYAVDFASGDGNATWNTASSGTCATTDCHNNNIAQGTNAWYTTGGGGCAMCHTVNPTTDTTHLEHTAASTASSYGRTIGCTDCHNAVTWSSAAPSYANGHIGGTWTIVNNSNSYTGTSITKVKGNCNANGCHEDGLGNNPAVTMTWGTAYADACNVCHLAAMTSSGHADHLSSNVPELKNTTFATLGSTDDCVVCHNTTTNGAGLASGSAHLDNSSDLSFKTAYNYEATTAARAAGAAGTTTCSNISCHNGVTTPTWGAGSIACGQCHGNGSGPLPNQTNVTRSHPYHANNDAVYTDCDKCHGATGVTVSGTYTAAGGGGASGLHQNLVVDMWINAAANRYSDAANTSGGVNYAAAGATHVDDGTCSTTACHGTKVPQWGVYSDTVSGCRVCHDPTYASYDATSTPLPPTVAQVRPTSPHIDADGSGATWAAGECRGCHAGHNQGVGIPLPPTTWPNASGETHVNANMQTTLGFTGYTAGGNINIAGPASAPTDNGARPQVHTAIRGLTTEAEVCWACHDNLATKVSEWGFNTKTTPAGFPVIQIPVAESGDTSQESYDYGWLFTSNTYGTKTSSWVAGGSGGVSPWWRSPYDNNLKQRVASVHAVDFDAAGHSSSVALNVDASGNVNNKYAANATLETVDKLRCTYCHDVHDTQGPTGKPYVRGNWVGNPYPADVPPRSGYVYPTTGGPGNAVGNKFISQWGAAVPRLYATHNYGSVTENQKLKGGFFIDQNSNNPTANTAMDTLDETAGLCTLCHSTAVNTMDYYTGSKLWRSTQGNGHANSTMGGTGTGKVNIFDARRGSATTTQTMANQPRVPVTGSGCCGGNPAGPDDVPAYPWSDFMNFNNYGGGRLRNSGWFGGANMGTTTLGGGDYTNWYTNGGIGSYTGTAGGKAHNFTCAKCHSPHAAALPALLITNCLDATLATWSANGGAISPLMTTNQPNNCHRKEAGTPDNSGWHRLNAGQALP